MGTCTAIDPATLLLFQSHAEFRQGKALAESAGGGQEEGKGGCEGGKEGCEWERWERWGDGGHGGDGGGGGGGGAV